MANTVTPFFQTLVAAATEASQVLSPTHNASESVFVNYRPQAATLGETLNVAIPQDPSNSVADQGAGETILTDIGFNTVAIKYNQHPSISYLIPDFQQYNAVSDIRTAFLDSALTGIKNYINAKITALFTTGNFSVNAAIPTTGHVITASQFLAGWTVLSDQRVPVVDPSNMSLLVPSQVYAAILGDNTWTQASTVSDATAREAKSSSVMPTQYGMTLKLDQQMPTSGSAPSRTYTAAYLHKWAVAMVTRPLPAPSNKVVDFTWVNFAGVPIRIQVGYNQYPKQGYIVTIDAGFGLKVVRPEMCQLFTVAE